MRQTGGAVLRLPDRQMRRHILAQRHLTPRTAGANSEVIAEDLVGLHATGTTSPYLQLLSRMTGSRRSDLDQALYHDRALDSPQHAFGRSRFARWPRRNDRCS